MRCSHRIADRRPIAAISAAGMMWAGGIAGITAPAPSAPAVRGAIDRRLAMADRPGPGDHPARFELPAGQPRPSVRRLTEQAEHRF